MECPARNAAVEPNFLHRDLPDISVKVMHLNEGAAYRERHLPTVAHYEVVTNPFPAVRGTDGDEGGADRDEPQDARAEGTSDGPACGNVTRLPRNTVRLLWSCGRATCLTTRERG
jgi:hypothetical protein